MSQLRARVGLIGRPADPPLAGARTRTARGALWLSVGSWGAKGAQTVALLVLAKALAPSEFGILAIAALTYNVVSAVNQLGVADALTYLEDRVEEASRTALSMVLGAGVILMGVTWALAPLIAHFFHSPDATFVVRGFALCLPFDAAAGVPIGRLTRSLKFSRRTITDTMPSVIGAAVTIVVVVSGHPLVGLVSGQIVGSLTNFVVAMAIGPPCLPGWNTDMARRLLRYGGYLSAADLVNLGLLNVDYIIVGHVLGPVALGYYSLAYRICFMPYLSISVVANGAVFPYYCRLPSQEAKARTAENTFCVINALSIPWFAGLVLFAGDIALLGHKWAPAAGAVRFLAVYGFFLSLTLSFLQVLKAVGRSDLVLLGRGVHLAVLTAVLMVTVRGGITVVAMDQALVAGAIALVTALWIVRRASVRPGAIGRSVGLPLLGALGMVPVALLLGRLPGVSFLRSTPSFTSLLILGPLALAVFAVVLMTVMPEPLRSGWAALRGGSDGPLGTTPVGPEPVEEQSGVAPTHSANRR
jgi:O-antigen/teichoic acid export membrane protein